MKLFVLFILFCGTLSSQTSKWGWDVHRFINEKAVDYLPAEMSVFIDHRDYLAEHAVDPDTDQLPGNYHYIDIDYYSEFFDGTLPHSLDSLTAIYNNSIIQDNGIVPWIIEQWTDSLSALIAAEKWNDVWQVAAELGHYVADSNQPLHLTLNYNGQLTNNYGIHSRYETHMINTHLSQLVLPADKGSYWPYVIDSVFKYIEETYPYVDSVLIADDLAFAQDPNFNSIYYNILWQELKDLTTISINRAILNVASVWITAWQNAKSPTYLDANLSLKAQDYFLADAYPNPFNATTNFEFSIPNSEFVSLKICNMIGQEMVQLVSKRLIAGKYKYSWNANGFVSGLYFYRIQTSSGFYQVGKLILLQ